jgi:UDP-2,4-diacetamido-2,4,6-trideoxy-beta-L-altropyranose hydrolase
MLEGEKFLIRADSGAEIGIGHLMRCGALAEELIRRGAEVIFLGRYGTRSQAQRFIGKWGSEFMETHCSELDETKAVLSIADEVRPSWLIIDGYQFTPDFQKAIRQAGYKLLIIDDYNHHDSYHADILLNQNIASDRLDYVHNPETVCLFGSDYILIRNEFLKYVAPERRIPQVPGRLLITLGGADPGNVTLKVIHALQRLDPNDLTVDLIMGPINPHFKIIAQEIARWKASQTCIAGNINILKDPSMPEMMNRADLAITAGGSTCYELAFMGVPMMIIILAENQEGIATAMEENKAAVNLGWHSELSASTIARQLKQIIGGPGFRNDLCANGRKVCDGLGPARVVEHLAAIL